MGASACAAGPLPSLYLPNPSDLFLFRFLPPSSRATVR
jgi:hypothetical protein